ncbi:cobalamin biosynthesis protein [Slackia heliotrinireducens]|uniref:Cobalamin biosynthesis protein CobD n=1 Tax=Slackia heliotrinireducens (strain ATCC 29202 / DSM 20476 / NCTC 11029 / RHS 1) TaxID=471855 RepID=C7N893_SLAHD|nr:adenosylcobinamide-phosphate synthase CbiB [Slackia heliotrinireducens]ACV23128.1 cobalamin biosynthesis protein CobD [Slackia heliotrinireducens DSM 20476]VEH02150.1 cobalamin biosynthesis protein [Slackia heliotrinireducens]
MLHHVACIAVGFVADLLFGDPYSLPHPVRWIGRLIAALENPLRRAFPKTDKGEFWAGVCLTVLVAGISTACAAGLIWACGLISGWLAFGVECLVCYQMLACKSLKVESMKVYDALVGGSLEDARHAVSMIVGRDTRNLDAQGITKATVETIAENASDGVVAPLLYMALFGPVGAVAYKSVNTMDSMVGYVNDRYRHFGTAAAKLDDVLNFLPARIGGALMCAAAGLVGQDPKGAWRMFRRDRLKHPSPNSAHTEAACAGALGIQLAGGGTYGGVYKPKPTLGDPVRDIESDDIVRANRLLYATSTLSVLAAMSLAAVLWVGIL